MCLNENIKEECTKLRKTYFSLSDCCVHNSGIHPIHRVYPVTPECENNARSVQYVTQKCAINGRISNAVSKLANLFFI
jgi:hypothetical protein